MKLILNDCLLALKELPDNSVDSVVTDPPYGLSFMGKSWDYDVPSIDIWKEALRVLKPGGYLLSFAGSRTYHRMAVNIEDAGFEIRDMIEWVYGSGFPKSLNIGKAYDKKMGNERDIIGTQKLNGNAAQSTKEKGGTYASNTNSIGVKPIEVTLTKGSSPYEGWGTALKPAHEPIVMARKPLIGTVVENVIKYGTGGINIDGCRVGHSEPVKTTNRQKDNGDTWNSSNTGLRNNPGNIASADPTGRFPANLIHDGSDEVLEVFPNNSARFFYSPKASKSERNAGLEGFEEKENKTYNNFSGTEDHSPKLDVKKQNFHPTVKPVALMRYLVRLVTPPNGTVLDPFMGSGTTGIASKKENFDFIGIEMSEEYMTIAQARIDSA